jgi:signal transduction histidine kinase
MPTREFPDQTRLVPPTVFPSGGDVQNLIIPILSWYLSASGSIQTPSRTRPHFMQQENPSGRTPARSQAAIGESIKGQSTDFKPKAIPHGETEGSFQATSARNPTPNEIARHLKQLLEAFHDEQIQLGRDFHEAAQNLSGVAFMADLIARDLKKMQSPYADRVKEIGSQLRKGIDDLRCLMADRAPNLIDRHGLAWTLRGLADRMSREGNSCTFEMSGEPVVSNHNAAILLLELAELAVDFITDCGRGKTTHIVLHSEDGTLLLGIKNDGICENKSLRLSENLLMIRSFLSLIGGSLELGSEATGGTYLTALIPADNRQS